MRTMVLSKKSELMQNWPAGPLILKNEIGFFQELLMENDFLRTWYLGFDWSDWIALPVKSEILITTGMAW